MEIAIPFADLGETMPAAGNCWNFNLCETLQGIGFFSMSPVANSFAEPGKFGILRFAGKNAPVVDFSSLGGLSGGVAEFRCGIKGGSPAQLEVNAMRYDETAQTEFPLFGETAAVSAEPRICFRAVKINLERRARFMQIFCIAEPAFMQADSLMKHSVRRKWRPCGVW